MRFVFSVRLSMRVISGGFYSLDFFLNTLPDALLEMDAAVVAPAS